ncbi:hypothetical protein PHYBLDRAFT_189012, partial [Phycomyces blakesleeanus NRRL 1555(-)]
AYFTQTHTYIKRFHIRTHTKAQYEHKHQESLFKSKKKINFPFFLCFWSLIA